MQINNINATNFEKKQTFVTPKMKTNIKYLLTRMNSEVIESGNENYFKNTIVKSLKKSDKAEFIDGRVEKTKFTMQGLTVKGREKFSELLGQAR